MPRVLTLDSTFLRSPTPTARVCISPSPLYTCSRRSLTSAKLWFIFSSSVFCSFSSTVWRISASCLLLSSRISASFISIERRMFSSFCSFSSEKVLSLSSMWPSFSLWAAEALCWFTAIMSPIFLMEFWVDAVSS